MEGRVLSLVGKGATSKREAPESAAVIRRIGQICFGFTVPQFGGIDQAPPRSSTQWSERLVAKRVPLEFLDTASSDLKATVIFEHRFYSQRLTISL